MRALSSARCTDARLYTLRIKIGFQNNERPRALALLNSPLWIDILAFAQLLNILKITTDDYFVTSNGAVFGAIQAAYIVLLIMGYLHVSCLPSAIILPASVCLYI